MNTIIRVVAVLILAPVVAQAGEYQLPAHLAKWVKYQPVATVQVETRRHETVALQAFPVPTPVQDEPVSVQQMTDAPAFTAEPEVRNVASRQFSPVHDSRVLSDVLYR